MSVEPSMEEILSSIKRIIAEEGDGPTRPRRAPRAAQPAPVAAPAPAPSAYFDDGDDEDHAEVLELSDPMPAYADEPVDDAPFAAAPIEEAVTVPQPLAEPQIAPQVATLRAAAPRAAAPAPAAAPEPKPILSDRTAEASRMSLDSLTRLVSQPVATGADKADDNSLEGLVRSMLRPMLREWLDTNLPAMVEEMVASEIARITGQPR